MTQRHPRRTSRTRLVVAAAAVAAVHLSAGLGALGVPVTPAQASSALLPAAAAAAPAPRAVGAVGAQAATGTIVERRVIGHSVRGRPIRAFRVGDPAARTRAVALATMHGDEAAPRAILARIRDGRPVRGIDLWVVPVLNPDGFAAGTRANARGVDLNRNFPRAWQRSGGAGSRAASEPETRALMRFVRQVDPQLVVSYHQPLYGVDTYAAKRWWFVRRLADHLRLPQRRFDCGGGCHGTFTQWFNQGLGGAAVTVEYDRRPTWRRMNVQAPQQLVRALGGTR